MPAPFKQLTIEQFAQLVERFEFKRRINSVHMHHTWRPNRAMYKGHDSIVSMWRFHTQTKGWSDIAQHLSIAPDGTVWLGRSWNAAPVSAVGHNGSAEVGPFMFEIIGDFDVGKDPFDGAQKRTTLEVIARVQRKFKLPPEALRFHNQMANKSCPGSAIDFPQTVAEVRKLHDELARGATRGAKRAQRPFGEDMLGGPPVVEEALRTLQRAAPRALESEDADHPQEEYTLPEIVPEGRAPESERALGLSAQQMAGLRPHLVNLNMGQFSSTGELKTTQEDVDAIFGEHLPAALKRAEQRKEKLRLLFYAHGGLVKESTGLRIACNHVDWWKANNVYPIYFVWETGALETIGQLIGRSREQGQRALRVDMITDPLIETGVRALKGGTLWAGMKSSALRAAAQGGGARYVAEKLKEFCAKNGNKVELHAVGHSAGSIFHAHFLSAATDLGVPAFKSGHFLAPAVRVDEFNRLLGERMLKNKCIDHLTLYTMSKDFELADNVIQIYRKSLLYLIYYALEAERETPILGMQVSLRADPLTRNLFGLAGASSSKGEVVWSRSALASGRSASQCTTHGGFDDDAATLGSIARRVLGKADADSIVEYPAGRSAERGGIGADQVDWPEELRPTAVASAPSAGVMTLGAGPAPTRAAGGGRRRALCIGINAYQSAPLNGCVRDAQTWAQTFTRLGFEQPIMLADEQATRSEILNNLRQLVRGSSAGDVIAFQYAGHGTQLPDVSGDEEDALDEALCPYDYASGAFLIDDDIAEVFAEIPAGVNFTCIFDCCHSGTNTRFAVGASGAAAAGKDERRRFMAASPEIKEAHLAFRKTLGVSRAADSGGAAAMKNIAISACLPHEVAWESEGQGEFTVRATQVLRGGGALTNQAFVDQVVAAFGANARQRPMLDCREEAKSLPFLVPLGGAGAVGEMRPAGTGEFKNFLQALQSLITQASK